MPIARIRRYMMLLCFWLLVGVLSTAQGYFSGLAAGNTQAWSTVFGYTLPWYVLWALFTPLVIAITRRIGFDLQQGWKIAASHLFCGAIIAVLHTACYVAYASLTFRASLGTSVNTDFLFSKIASAMQGNMMTYLLIAGAVVAGTIYTSLRQRELDSALLGLQLAQAETAALRAQMRPHFLFNSLNAIAALAETDGSKAVSLIARLSELLRASLRDHDAQESLLRDEIAFMDGYLEIEKARLNDRLRIEKRIAADALRCKVPTMLLQPLVENAVQHGIAPGLAGGTITVCAELGPGALKLTIADDGAGAGRITERVGLGNIRKRMARLYPHGSLFEIATAPGKGFRVTVMVPQ